MKKKLVIGLLMAESWATILPAGAKAETSADVSVSATAFDVMQNSYQYRIITTNNGPDAAQRVELISPLPAGTSGFVTHRISPVPEGCDNFSGSQFSFCYTSLPAGNSVVIDIVLQVTDPNVTAITHQTAVSSNIPDLNPANNQVSLKVNLNRPQVTPTSTPSTTPTNKGYIVSTRSLRSNFWRRHFFGY